MGAKHDEHSETLKSEDDIPACQSCRCKKARCSREQPCSQCVRFDVTCIYDDRRLKPGLRAGVVENLSRRIETLENMFLGQEILWKQMWETLHPDSQFPGSPGKEAQDAERIRNGSDIQDRQEKLKSSLLQVAASRKDSAGAAQVLRPAKRQRAEVPMTCSPDQETHAGIAAAEIIASDLLGQLVEFYFENIHHWIPVLHVRRFRHRIQSHDGRTKAKHILYAIIAVCIRFVDDPRLPDEDRKAQVAESCRQEVLLCCMESFSVQNLQALVIIAFDRIARGRGPSSWSVVGSMARTVEQLQLSVEEDELYGRNQAEETLIRRMAFLKPSSCWREAEERRRVFWTVFTSNAAYPARAHCGSAKRKPGRPISASPTKDTGTHRPGSLLVNSPLSADPTEQDCIGGFAYCIEATE
ncbi:hypothetical protein BDV10DRAFT_180224 [Aspergillus recurvatus]